MKFQPSRLSYGADAAAANAGASSPATPSSGSESGGGYEAYVPLVSEFFWGDDPREELAILEAKIVSYRAKVKSAVWPLNKYYEGELAKMEARATALRKIVAETQRSVDTTQVTKVVLIGVGVAAALAIFGVIGVQTQRIRLMESQRQAELQKLRGALA